MMDPVRVIVDADSCPKSCFQIIKKLALKYHLVIITVASFNHRIDSENHIITGDEDQATDIAVVNQTRAGDIVVTQDWGLAAMILGKSAKAIAPNGRIYQAEQMALLLEERNIMAKFRRSGGHTKGPPQRIKKDDDRFEQNLVRILEQTILG
jgi:uncharacterized protein YaiI (UPF0178 family)